jgi:hypothetical protein
MNNLHSAEALNALVTQHQEKANASCQEVESAAVASFLQSTWTSYLIITGSLIPTTETYDETLRGPHLPCNIMDCTNKNLYSASKFVYDATLYPCSRTGSLSSDFLGSVRLV